MESAPFDSISFDTLANEATVRELVCHPLLRALGFDETEIQRDPSLRNPSMPTGCRGKCTPITFRPDYLAYRKDRCLIVLDAKAPGETVDNPHHVLQAYSYAVHPEVRDPLSFLCNRKDLAVWRTADPPSTPALRIDLPLWSTHAQEVHCLLAQYESLPPTLLTLPAIPFDYRSVGLPFRVERQSAKRH